jgi:hypothetical protein
MNAIRLTEAETAEIIRQIGDGKFPVSSLEGLRLNTYEVLVHLASDMLVLRELARNIHEDEIAAQLDNLLVTSIERARDVAKETAAVVTCNT